MLLSFVARKVGRKLMSKRAMTFAQRKALQKAQKASALARKSLKYGKKVNKSFDKTKAHNLKALKQLKGMVKKGNKSSWIKDDIKAVTKGMESNLVRQGYVKNLVKSVRKDVKAKGAIQKNMEKTLTKKYGAGMVKSASRVTRAQVVETAQVTVGAVAGAYVGTSLIAKSAAVQQKKQRAAALKQANAAMKQSASFKKSKKQ